MSPARNEKYQLLRQHAEQLLQTEPERFKTPEQLDIASLLHELAVFQAELEMQNEELRQAQLQTEEALSQYARLYDLAPVGYLRLNEFGMILHHNQTFAEIIKTDRKTLVNQPLVKLLLPDDRDLFYARFKPFFHSPSGKTIEVRFTLPQEETIVASLTARRDLHCVTTDAVQPTLLVIVSDITEIWHHRQEQEQSRDQLDFLARHDPLTGLANRLLFSSHLAQALERAARQGTLVALLLLDLDRFKDVNDSFGHAAGDELLVQVAQRITGRLRGADSISRLGGDEFTVVLEDIHEPQDAAWVANELIGLVRKPFQLTGVGELSIGTSIGIALYPDHGATEQTLLQQADAALYRAKADGRSLFRFFSEELTREARERIQLEGHLRKALDTGELLVHFQPQFDMQTGAIVGAEALARWNHPVMGMIQPAQFIPLAEETGLITRLGEWVLRETCNQGSRWLAQGLPPIRLAVNLSPQQLRHAGIAGSITAILEETGFPPELLEIEVTESALMLHGKEAEQILKHISGLGVSLALDDFGTGYSSLARLKQFPLQILKIDRSFIADILNNQTDREIAATIVAMGHTLGFKVLAEGVEQDEQLTLLRLLPCDLYQGYLSGRPMPADDFFRLVKNLQPSEAFL